MNASAGRGVSAEELDMDFAELLQLQEVLQLSSLENLTLSPSNTRAQNTSATSRGTTSGSETDNGGPSGTWECDPEFFDAVEDMATFELADEVGVDCEICQETKPFGSMLYLRCGHNFCLLCMSQHGKVAVEGKKVPIRCPSPGCSATLSPDDYELCLDDASLTKALLFLAESSISDDERFFCPYKNCSTLMVVDVGDRAQNPCATCQVCKRDVCMSCSVPWHVGVTCRKYQETPEGERDPNDFKVKHLAQAEGWMRCYRCKSLVERSSGCPHMTCRCKAEFCYKCGKPWISSKPTCKCFV